MKAKDILSRMKVKPQKSRGQNFVIVPNAITAIMEFAKLQASEAIVEIGPGLGALTEQLAHFPEVSVVEIEAEFCSLIRAKFPNIVVYHQDVRSFQFCISGKKITVIGNLPYSLSSEIIQKLLAERAGICRAILMLQKEFAERLAARPGTKAYGSLSVACQVWAETRLGPIISGAHFHPKANVDSKLIELSFFEKPKIDIGDPDWFDKVVRSSFTERRKQLKNSLRASGRYSGEAIDGALKAARIDPMRRAETLTIEEFGALSKELLSLSA